jgi:hypothetical protein
MKRCVFVGPSLYGVTDRPAEIEFRPPAAQGDLIRAAAGGARWIGLIDGYFGTCASVWHKEILYALSIGCHVWGASSMGALRAAECQSFGMRPVGLIASQFASGDLEDDADVALVHGPAEADYVPLTEPLVDARPTIAAMLAAGAIDRARSDDLIGAARSLHFAERTVEEVAKLATDSPVQRKELETLYEVHRVRAKQIDAILLVEEMCIEPPEFVREDEWRRPAASASMEKLTREFKARPDF